jgi:dihydropteroate synthase
LRGPYLIELDNIEKARRVFQEIGPDSAGLEIMLEKERIYPLYVQKVKSPAANILKQNMLSVGGEAVVGRGVVNMGAEETDVLLLGTLKQYKALGSKLPFQPWGLKKLGENINLLFQGIKKNKQVIWNWPAKQLVIGEKVLIMGILNITPDSFSDGGLYLDPQKALSHARQMVEDGADIIDVGAESTRPGSQPISCDEELDRVLPVIELLRKEIPVPISLDTYRARTANEALSLGVEIINDVGGGKKDPEIAKIVAEYNAPVIIMHNEKMSNKVSSGELVAGVIEGLRESLRIYEKAGLPVEKIMIDPGIGFGKGPEGNLILLNNLQSFQSLNIPILLGASRKSFIGAVLDTVVSERLEGSLAAAAWGVIKGASILRVHDVKETVRLVRLLEAVKNAK